MPLFALGAHAPRLIGRHHYVAHDATVVGNVTLDDNVSVWFQVVIRADNDVIHVGEASNIQDGSVLHCDPGFPLVVGSRVTVGHNVTLHGCMIGEGSLIGINSVIMNGARIGAGSLVGAGALVPEGKQFPPGVLILGAPARVIRELTADEQAKILWASQNYVERSRMYATQMRAHTGTKDAEDVT